ncbi:GNAT family N-acetyltransferase [Methylobacterium radiotolerans]|uniref:GNAT family N-acetyltransferase n=1 Tax=Methylobacterium radiotolerans TaxID=31998 RepID=UPI0015F6EB00|nr:GNAT family N-acetyltransferase [Methylobacterium radiotolerans]
MSTGIEIQGGSEATIPVAIDLLTRFFREEGFGTLREQIALNTQALANSPNHWLGLASMDGQHVGVVTVTTALYVEWGRLGEIGDLYVLPERRQRGVASALIAASEAQCTNFGCSSVSVVVTDVGEARHKLRTFYHRRGFASDGRTILTRSLT